MSKYASECTGDHILIGIVTRLGWFVFVCLMVFNFNATFSFNNVQVILCHFWWWLGWRYRQKISLQAWSLISTRLHILVWHNLSMPKYALKCTWGQILNTQNTFLILILVTRLDRVEHFFGSLISHFVYSLFTLNLQIVDILNLFH